MYLKLLNRLYLMLGIFLLLIFGSVSIFDFKTLLTFGVILISFVTFAMFVLYYSTCNLKNINVHSLFFTVVIYCLLNTVILYLFSYYMSGDFFLFSKRDAIIYLEYSMYIKDLSYSDAIKYMFRGYGFDDLGPFLWLTTIFKFMPNQLAVGVANSFLAGGTALNLFVISKKIMPIRYASLVALTFVISPFLIVRGAQITKEPLFVFIVIAAFRFFYDYLSTKKNIYLILAFLITLLTVFFRLPIFFILVFSFAATVILKKVNNISAVILIFVIGLILASTSMFDRVFDRYLRGGDIDAIVDRKNSLAMGGGVINQITDPIAALIGPFPSAVIELYTPPVLYFSGLLFRVIVAAPFLLSSYFIIKKRIVNLYPFLIFFFINALGLMISVKGLELRLSLPHLSMVYIVAFWGIFHADRLWAEKKIQIINQKQSFICISIVVMICLLWNIRGFL